MRKFKSHLAYIALMCLISTSVEGKLCKKEGDLFVREDRNEFILCERVTEDGGLIPVRRHCEDGRHFSPDTLSCVTTTAPTSNDADKDEDDDSKVNNLQTLEEEIQLLNFLSGGGDRKSRIRRQSGNVIDAAEATSTSGVTSTEAATTTSATQATTTTSTTQATTTTSGTTTTEAATTPSDATTTQATTTTSGTTTTEAATTPSGATTTQAATTLNSTTTTTEAITTVATVATTEGETTVTDATTTESTRGSGSSTRFTLFNIFCFIFPLYIAKILFF